MDFVNVNQSIKVVILGYTNKLFTWPIEIRFEISFPVFDTYFEFEVPEMCKNAYTLSVVHWKKYIKHERLCFTIFRNTEKRVSA